MGKYALPLVLALCYGSPAALAQTSGGIPDATVGVPYNLALIGNIFTVTVDESGLAFTITVSLTGGTLPPGLTLSEGGVISGTPTSEGQYDVTLTFDLTLTQNGQFISDTPSALQETLEVDPFPGSSLAIDPTGVSFSLQEGATNVVSQSVLISNRGDPPQTFTASVDSTGGWLSVSPASGTAPVGSSSVTISVNPSGLTAGAYSGSVVFSLTPSGQTFSVPVIATVNSNQDGIQLSQTGFLVQTESGAGTSPSETLSILDGGSGSFPFSVSAFTVSGGTWLSVSPSSGTASSSPSPLAISVNPTNLKAGAYYGQIQVSGTGVGNSPQVANIVLNIVAAGTDLGAVAQPTGVIFVAQAGSANPGPQTVSVTTPNSAPLTFNTALSFQPGSNWFSVQPANGSVSAASPLQLTIQPAIAGLADGVYTGNLTLNFSDMTAANVAVLLIVTQGSVADAQPAVRWTPHTTGCTPTTLLPVFTLLGSGFATVAAWPTPIALSIVDDCGNSMTAGSVTASFSTGDPAISLLSLGGGSWSATWQPAASAAQATITVLAQQNSPALQGTASIGGSLEANPTTPLINAGGAVSAASYVANQPLAPGSFVSIFGSN
ncbi:MAG: hypothetical protein ABSB86_12695, partial [Bryobacteraceae bacterium]